MAMELEKLENGWQIIFSRNASGRRVLWDVSGDGESFTIPEGFVEIRKRALNRTGCPNLKECKIPAHVQLIRQDAFDGFGPELQIYCEKPSKPMGYFDGEYTEELHSDGSPYFVTHYGTWLRRSVVIRSEDNNGELTWISNSAEQELAVRPTVTWGAQM